MQSYRRFVDAGKNQPSPLGQLKNQIYLGSDKFVQEVQAWIKTDISLDEIPSVQNRPVAKPLEYYLNRYSERDRAASEAYGSGDYTMREIAAFFNVHYSTVSRAVKGMKTHNARYKT